MSFRRQDWNPVRRLCVKRRTGRCDPPAESSRGQTACRAAAGERLMRSFGVDLHTSPAGYRSARAGAANSAGQRARIAAVMHCMQNSA